MCVLEKSCTIDLVHVCKVSYDKYFKYQLVQTLRLPFNTFKHIFKYK